MALAWRLMTVLYPLWGHSPTASQVRCCRPGNTTENLSGSRRDGFWLGWETLGPGGTGGEVLLVAGVSRNAAGMRDWKLSRRLRDQRSAYKTNCFKLPGTKTWKSLTYPPLLITGVSFTNQQSFATIICREYFLEIQPSIKLLD